MDLKAIGKHVKSVRKEIGINRRQAAKKIGIAERTLATVESGAKVASTTTYQMICDGLDTSFDVSFPIKK